MKYCNKLMIFYLFLLFGYGIDTFGYTYTISNMTGRDVKVLLYWDLGRLTNRSALIAAYDTRKLSFGGWEAGLCLTKIMVWMQDSTGKWWGPEEAKMVILKDKGRFKDIKESGLVGNLVIGAIELFGFSLCQSRDFILVRLLVDDRGRISKKMYAITDIDI